MCDLVWAPGDSFSEFYSQCLSGYYTVKLMTYFLHVYACELWLVSRINVNKYTFITLIFCRLYIHKKNKSEKNVQSV